MNVKFTILGETYIVRVSFKLTQSHDVEVYDCSGNLVGEGKKDNNESLWRCAERIVLINK